jgi:hypothetical protein
MHIARQVWRINLTAFNHYIERKKSVVLSWNGIALRDALDCTWLYKTVHMSKIQFK